MACAHYILTHPHFLKTFRCSTKQARVYMLYLYSNKYTKIGVSFFLNVCFLRELACAYSYGFQATLKSRSYIWSLVPNFCHGQPCHVDSTTIHNMVKIKVLILLRRPQPILPTTVCPSTFALHTHADELILFSHSGEKICYPPKNIYHSAWHEQNCGLVKNFPSSEMQKQKIENLGNRQKAESGAWTKGGERGRERTISCSLSYWALGQAKQAPPYLQGPREDAAPRHRPSLLLLSPRRWAPPSLLSLWIPRSWVG